jgi:hypothetical protein
MSKRRYLVLRSFVTNQTGNGASFAQECKFEANGNKNGQTASTKRYKE